MKNRIPFLAVVLWSLVFASTAKAAPQVATVPASGYFSTPDQNGPEPFIHAIKTARTSVRMWMFTLNNKAVVQALSDSAKGGVKIQLILNYGMFTKAPALIKSLQESGVQVSKGSAAFSITHAKTALFDNSYALITTMNLTSGYRLTRDAGLRVDERTLLNDLNEIFEADLANAKSGGDRTPVLKSQSLVVSPVNALPRLLNLIDSADREILTTVENFSQGPISEHLIKAAQRGVKVKVLAPFCNLNSNPFFNFEVLAKFAGGGVDARVLPYPASASAPYMHQKMMLVDGEKAYYGSENFTYNSLKKAREIGVIVDARSILRQILADFNSDWKISTALPAQPEATCSVFGGPHKAIK